MTDVDIVWVTLPDNAAAPGITQEWSILIWRKHFRWHQTILNKIINAPCGTLKLLLALGVAKYIKSYKIHFVVQYATDYCPLEHDNYIKTISAHLGSPISCYINNLHGGVYIFAQCISSQNEHLHVCKGLISSWSEQTFDRAWNYIIMRPLAHYLCSSHGNMILSRPAISTNI